LSGTFAQRELERAEAEVRQLGRPPEILRRALGAAERLRPHDCEVSLLHGDPLLQNLILHLDFERPGESFTWIDWEFARLGDPAYDLSIFTRGRLGSLCGLKGGRSLYLEAYGRHSGAPVEEKRLLFYEILLLVRQGCDQIREGHSALPEAQRRLLEGFLGRIPGA
jgi:aminoglycoside phosphotransferase (APT) family kinase protein